MTLRHQTASYAAAGNGKDDAACRWGSSIVNLAGALPGCRSRAKSLRPHVKEGRRGYQPTPRVSCFDLHTFFPRRVLVLAGCDDSLIRGGSCDTTYVTLADGGRAACSLAGIRKVDTVLFTRK